jgi:hypothetical protein
MNIVLDKDTLWINYNKFVHKWFLRHYHYDVFEVISTDDPESEGGDGNKVRFLTNNKGDIGSFETQMDASVKDILFTRIVADVSATDLQQYTGDYEMIGQTAKVYIKGNALFVFLPGQPDYELVPTKKHEFDLRALQGYSVRFELNAKGEIASLSFIQPNGIFKAIKKNKK